MPIKTDREYRDVYNSLVPQDDEKRVTGYATVFDVPYKLYGDGSYEIWEKVAPTAFANTDVSDVIMQYNHEGRVFARTKNNTLTLRSDEKGLLIDADLGGTEIGRELYEEIRGGYTDKMSFGFTIDRTEETRTDLEDGKIDILRRILSVSKLYDVSAVSIPANGATSISVETRSQIDGAIEAARAERLNRAKLELKKQFLRGVINND